MKVFHPITSENVSASEPHPANTFYKVSVGIEYWGETAHEVCKVQMVYDGEVSGRRSPSYPVHTDDFARVTGAMTRLEDQAFRKLDITADPQRLAAFKPDSIDAKNARKKVTNESVNRIVEKVKASAK
jgi:hypothetical protein